MRNGVIFTLAVELLLAAAFVSFGQSQESTPIARDAFAFVEKAFDTYQVVAIGDLPGCEQLHAFLRTLNQMLIQAGRVDEIIVDFGNPRLQQVVDRFVLQGEMVPQNVLRHVWDDTTRSLTLTWDSPVYEEFFDSVRTANLPEPADKRVRVVLADAPIDWSVVRSRADFEDFSEKQREQTLAEQINKALSENKRTLVICMPKHLVRVGSHAVSLVNAEHPGEALAIVTQGRFGTDNEFRDVESREKLWESPIIVRVNDAGLGTVSVWTENGKFGLTDVAQAILYLGPSETLTRLYPWATIFQDDGYWKELNRRSQIVNGQPFDLARADFDLRGKEDDVVAPIDRSAHMPVAACCERSYFAPSRAPSTAPTEIPDRKQTERLILDSINFVLEALDRHPMVGLGDDHMGLQFYEFLDRLIRDPRVPGKVNDIVVEFGNPRFQGAMDRYVVEGVDVPRAEREDAWRYAAEGWYVANSPVYEHFFDSVREVNLSLPRDKRIRVILGDAPVDLQQFLDDPRLLAQFTASRETPKDPREIALGGSVNRVLAQGHRGLMICGDGHLLKGHRPGNARALIDREHPGAFYLIDTQSCPVTKSLLSAGSDSPHICLGAEDSLTGVRPSPLLYRDKAYFHKVSRLYSLLFGEPMDLRHWKYEYRGRYFEEPLPFEWPRGAMEDSNSEEP